MSDGTALGVASTFNTLTGQTLASQHYSNSVLGPCVIGWSMQLCLWGFVLSWGANYINSELFRKDPTRRKALLISVLALATFQAGQNVYLLFTWTCRQERAAEDLIRPAVPDALQPLSTAILGPLVQAFLAKRAIRLLHARWAKWTATIGFSIVITCEAVAAIFNVSISLLFHAGALSGVMLKLATYNYASGIWLLFGALADVGITVLLCVVLKKRIHGFNQTTDFRLNTLAKLAIQSASYTAVTATLGAVAAYAMPTDNLLLSSVPYPFWYILPSLYPIALLTALSSRKIFSNKNSTYMAGETIKTNFMTLGVPATGAGGNGIGGDFRSPGSPSPRYALSPNPASDRPRSRFFDAVDFRSTRNSPQTRTRKDMGAKSIQVQVEKHVSVVVDSDDETDFSIPYTPLRRPAPAGRSTTAGRTREKDLEAGLDVEEDYAMGTITGKSMDGRKEAWE